MTFSQFSYDLFLKGGTKKTRTSPLQKRELVYICYFAIWFFVITHLLSTDIIIFYFFNIQKQEQKQNFIYLTQNIYSCPAKMTQIFYVLQYLCEATLIPFLDHIFLFQQQKHKNIYYPVRSQGPDTFFITHTEICFFNSDGPTHKWFYKCDLRLSVFCWERICVIS